METIIVAVVLGVLGFPIWVIVQIGNIKKKITQLEARVNTPTASQSVTPHAAVPTTAEAQNQSVGSFIPQSQQTHTAIPTTQPQSTIPTPATTPPENNRFIAWLLEDVFMKLGALLLLIGFGWFVSYAFMNNWIGPVGRISLGILAGVFFMAGGTWWIKSHRHQGSVFLVLGSGIVLLTLFAARELYNFLTPEIALLVMFLSITFVAFVSVLYQSEKLALAGLIMAGIAPFLTNTPEPTTMGIMTYLLIVILGTLWVVRLTGSHVLTFAAVLLVSFYSLPYIIGSISGAEQILGLFFSFGFVMLFFISNTLSIVYSQSEAARKGQLATAIATGTFLFIWIIAAVRPEMQSLAYVFWTLIFSVGTFLVYARTTDKVPFFVYSTVTVGLLFAATAAELSGYTLTLAYTAEITAIILVARRLLGNSVAKNLLWLYAVPIGLTLPIFDIYVRIQEISIAGIITIFTVGLTMAVVSLLWVLSPEEQDIRTPKVTLTISSLFGLSLVWMILHTILPHDTATTVSLVLYTIIGLGLLVVGRMTDVPLWRLFGGVLLGGVVLRLLLIDVWQMELVGRIITFFVVGLLLISTAFMGKKSQSNITTE